MQSKTVRTPAKINLYLAVKARRADGYHELETVFLPVPELTDEISVGPAAPGQLTVHCGDERVPDGTDNICYRAAAQFAATTGVEPAWAIEITKRIPVAAGMGGGSSDAAGVLKLLNQISEKKLSDQQLHAIATGLGADVPFFLNAAPALATGIGEQLKSIECGFTPHLILINPGFPLPTRWAYSAITPGASDAPPVNGLLDGLATNDVDQVAAHTYNSFESVVCHKYPIVEIIIRFLREHGAACAHLCGSGPTVYALFTDATTSERARAAAREYFGNQYWVW
jgi:4-diphosphocytidyl-2-C-methyl-D-erythritol kinase